MSANPFSAFRRFDEANLSWKTVYFSEVMQYFDAMYAGYTSVFLANLTALPMFLGAVFRPPCVPQLSTISIARITKHSYWYGF